MAAELLNPDSEMLRQMDGLWQQIAALLVHRIGEDVFFSGDEITAFTNCAKCNLVISGDGDNGFGLRLVDRETAVKLALNEGGLPS